MRLQKPIWAFLICLVAGLAMAGGIERAPKKNLKDLNDVNAPSPTNLDVLTYDSATGKWLNASGSTGAGILTATQTWSGGNTYQSSSTFNGAVTFSTITVTSSATVSGKITATNASNFLGGDGAAITNVPAASIASGSLGANVQCSSVAAASVGITQLSITAGIISATQTWTGGNTYSLPVVINSTVTNKGLIVNSIANSTNHILLVSSNDTTTEMMAVDGNGITVIGSTVVIGTVTTAGSAQNPSGETMQVHNTGVRSGIRFTTAGSGVTAADGIFYGLDASNGYMSMAETRNLLFATNGTNRATILSGGNMGIGTVTPTTKLHVSSGTLTIDGSSPGLTVGTTNFVITGGNIGIGTSVPATKVHISSATITWDGTPVPTASRALCINSSNQVSYCTSIVGADGSCTCN